MCLCVCSSGYECVCDAARKQEVRKADGVLLAKGVLGRWGGG